jgi:hypothetical protein
MIQGFASCHQYHIGAGAVCGILDGQEVDANTINPSDDIQLVLAEVTEATALPDTTLPYAIL